LLLCGAAAGMNHSSSCGATTQRWLLHRAPVLQLLMCASPTHIGCTCRWH
jgi:hypothetical protein